MSLVVTNVTHHVTLVSSGRVADTLWTRLVGLLRDKHLANGDGLWIVPCNSIHSFAMKFRFDAIFLDAGLRVVYLIEDMAPWRASPIKLEAKSVLELPSGVIARSGTKLGDQMEMGRDPA